MGKKLLVGLFSVLILFFIIGCNNSQSSNLEVTEQKVAIKKDELAISMPDEIRTLDPVKAQNSWELQLVSNLYEGLVSFNPDTNKIEPALASNWSVSSDGLEYTFFLRNKALFHSGKTVSATDVKKSWERAIKSAKRETWHIFHKISGFEQFLQGRTVELIGITVLDDQKLQVSLDQADETFLYKLTHPAAYIVDVEFINDSSSGYGVAGSVEQPSRVNGTGPYALVEWVNNQHITFKAFKEYPLKSQFKRIDFLLTSDIEKSFADLQRGYADILRTDQKLPRILVANNLAIEKQQKQELTGEIYYLGFNLKRELFHDQRLRQGISLAIDRSKLATELQNARAGAGLLPRTVVQGRSPLNEYRYSPNSARKLIDYNAEGLSKEKELTIYYVKDDFSQIILEEIAHDLKQVGLKVKPKEVSTQQELIDGIKTGNILFFLDKWTAQTGEAGFFLAPFFYSNSPHNITGYSNDTVDELIELSQQQKAFSKEYLDTILQIEKIIMSDFPVITILEGTDYLMTNELIEDPAFDPITGLQLEKVRVKSELAF